MSKDNFTPEFGPNGSVLNSSSMTENMRREYEYYEWKSEFRNLHKPKTWPSSAIFLLLVSGALLGAALTQYFSDEVSSSTAILLIGSLALSAIARAWRHVWEKRLKA